MGNFIELIGQLESIHPDLYRNYDKKKFYKELSTIKFNNKFQLKVDLSKVLAKLNDGHTSILFDKETTVELRYINGNIYIIDDYKKLENR